MDTTTDPTSGSFAEALWDTIVIGGGAAVSPDGLDAGGTL
jgi:hypothetical protein